MAASELAALVAPAESVVLCAQIEAEVATLDAADAAELLAGYGQDESGLVQLVRVGFRTLGLQTFLTAGPKESRAWTIHVGDTAPQAAGTIHTDFERGFIKAEIVGYDDLVEAGSLAAVRAAGKARVEGKEYVIRTVTWSSSASTSRIRTSSLVRGFNDPRQSSESRQEPVEAPRRPWTQPPCRVRSSAVGQMWL